MQYAELKTSEQMRYESLVLHLKSYKFRLYLISMSLSFPLLDWLVFNCSLSLFTFVLI